MPSRKARYVYWDSCVFLAYIDKEPGRVDVIERVWDEVSDQGGDRIVTSVLSIAEVAHAGYEKKSQALDPAAIAAIDAMWKDPSVLIVETPAQIMYIARDLMRDATAQGWSLRPGDAIQLATAKWVHQYANPITAFHTYDGRIFKYTAMIGIKIVEPEPLSKNIQLPLIPPT